jgi:hypothetical protein
VIDGSTCRDVSESAPAPSTKLDPRV